MFFVEPLPSVSNAQEEAQVAKAWLEAKQTWVTKEKNAFGKQKGKCGQQWQNETGKDGKPQKGKGNAMAHQWQQQNAANEWTSDQGTKNGGHRTGRQPNAARQGQFQG